MNRRRSVLALLLALAGPGTLARAEDGLMIGAAASLRGAMPALLEAFAGEAPPAPPPRVSYAASGQLRRQIEAGAPLDAVFLAGAEDVDALVAAGRAEASSRRVFASNVLVLIGPRGGPPARFATLAALPPGERIGIGDPRSVPAGRYAQQAFEALGSWDAVRARSVLAADVTGVLALVRRGEVAAGVVYETDARGHDDVRVLERAAGAWSPRPQLVAAVVAGASHPERARRLVSFAGTPRAGAILAEHGFGPPPAAAPP